MGKGMQLGCKADIFTKAADWKIIDRSSIPKIIKEIINVFGISLKDAGRIFKNKLPSVADNR